MEKVKKLSLKKKDILNFDEIHQIGGGFYNRMKVDAATGGCTDGCTVIGATLWNCTKETCTNDCHTIAKTQKACQTKLC